jgi:5-methylcytosine-specific restriction endonuclease McrA
MNQQLGPIVYPDPGACIYCGKVTPPMTDEHIIPLSLNGHMIFRRASCERCRKATHAFESVVIEKGMASFRIKYGARTRKPKKQRQSAQARQKLT